MLALMLCSFFICLNLQIMSKIIIEHKYNIWDIIKIQWFHWSEIIEVEWIVKAIKYNWLNSWDNKWINNIEYQVLYKDIEEYKLEYFTEKRLDYDK